MSSNPIENRDLNAEPSSTEPEPRPLQLGKLLACLYAATLLAASIWNQGCGHAPATAEALAFESEGPGMVCDLESDCEVAAAEECVGPDCPVLYDVHFSLAAAVPLGAVQFEVDYATAPGAFLGAGREVTCNRAAESSALAAFHNCTGPTQSGCDRAKLLRVGLAAAEPIETPAELVVCTMQTQVRAPKPHDFRLHVVEATDAGAEPISPTPLLYVTGIHRR